LRILSNLIDRHDLDRMVDLYRWAIARGHDDALSELPCTYPDRATSTRRRRSIELRSMPATSTRSPDSRSCSAGPDGTARPMPTTAQRSKPATGVLSSC
jgi:hypothetical protein